MCYIIHDMQYKLSFRCQCIAHLNSKGFLTFTILPLLSLLISPKWKYWFFLWNTQYVATNGWKLNSNYYICNPFLWCNVFTFFPSLIGKELYTNCTFYNLTLTKLNKIKKQVTFASDMLTIAWILSLTTWHTRYAFRHLQLMFRSCFGHFAVCSRIRLEDWEVQPSTCSSITCSGFMDLTSHFCPL